MTQSVVNNTDPSTTAVKTLHINGLQKSYGGRRVVDGVSFFVRRGEVVGLLGRNGAGKTTLLKILTQREEPDSGTVNLHASARMGFLEQHPEFAPGRTVREEASEALADLAALAKQAESVAAELAAARSEAKGNETILLVEDHAATLGDGFRHFINMSICRIENNQYFHN